MSLIDPLDKLTVEDEIVCFLLCQGPGTRNMGSKGKEGNGSAL